MTTKVKICGLSDTASLEAAIAGGADYVGLVFYPPSPRHVSLETATVLREAARGRVKTVALMVNPDDALVDQVTTAIEPDFVQLHGGEPPERCEVVRSRTGCRIIKAVKVASRPDVEAGLVYDGPADMILFDAKAPADDRQRLPGGNGLQFDWRLLDGIGVRLSFMLSGGLNPSNVAAGIKLTGAAAVDVSSGVEIAPGKKDPGMIAAFLAAAKAA